MNNFKGPDGGPLMQGGCEAGLVTVLVNISQSHVRSHDMSERRGYSSRAGYAIIIITYNVCNI
jgi:hypothetical protein